MLSTLLNKGDNQMQLTKMENKGIILTPQTAMEHLFIDCLVEMVEARETRFLNQHALELESLAPDVQPVIIESQA